MKKTFFLPLLTVSLALGVGVFSFKPNKSKTENNISDPTPVTTLDNRDVSHLKTYFDYNPQDEYFSKQGIALNHVGDIKKVWDKTKGEGTTIAIIDSGIDWTHPDFYDEDGNSKLLMEYARYYAHIKPDGDNWRLPYEGEEIVATDLKYFETSKKYILDGVTYTGNEIIRHNGATSHGTNTASTAASYGHGNTDVGVIGIAPMAKILPIKVDNYMDSIGESLGYILALNNDDNPNNDVDVVNISICGKSSWDTIVSNARALANKGTIIVASAGNDNKSDLRYPAADSNVIGVGALENDSSTVKASFSNYNPSDSTSSSTKLNVELSAPGHVYVADYDGSSTYKKTQGTSFSSPIVAGAAALWKSLHKSGTFAQFKTALFNSCVDIGASGWDTTFGYGRLDIGNLIGTSDIVNISSLDLPTSITLSEGQTRQLTPTVTPSNVTSHDYRWWSTNTNVATVDHNGLVTAESNGSATIYCKSLSNDNIKDTCTVNVSGNTVRVSGITLTSSSSLSLDIGQTSQISYTISPENATNKDVEYILYADDGVVSVSDTGLITALKAGEESIGVLTADGEFEATIDVVVKETATPSTPTTATTTYTFNSKTEFEESGSTNATMTADSGAFGYDATRGVQWSKKAATVTISNFPSSYAITSVSANVYANCTSTATVKVGSSSFGGSQSITDGSNQTITFSGNASGSTITLSLTAGSKSTYVKSVSVTYTTGSSTPTTTNYTVSFNSNGGSGTMSNLTTTGSTFITPNCGFTKSNYTFTKWALNSATGTKYSAGETITGISSNITLYANWVENSSPVDPTDYYSSISSSLTEDALLTSLRTLNLSKRTRTVGYSTMGTATSTNPSNSPFMYTDYDPSTVKYDTNGQPYGTKILSFYSGVSTTGWNKEHVWPASRLTGGRDHNAVDPDIYMPRPTISSENSDRGNSVFYEGRSDSTNGWDPVTAFGQSNVYTNIRGESARIIFYCMTVDSTLVLNESTSNSGNNMGRLTDLLKWNLNYPVNDREIRRQSGGQYLQGNRNAFVDHPEYACKIWGNTSAATRQICGITGKTLENITISNEKLVYSIGDSFVKPQVTATYTDGTTQDVTNTATYSGFNSATAGTRTITISYTEGGVTKTTTYPITVLTVEEDIHATGISLNKTSATISVGEDVSLVASLTPTNATNPVSWTSSNNSIATVSSGTVTGVSAGTATITATCNGLSATCSITVSSSVTPPPTPSGGYKLVTNEESLTAGDQILIVGVESDTYYTISPYSSGNNCGRTEVTSPVYNVIDTEAQFITLGGSKGAWTLFDGTNYLYASGGTTANQLKGKTSADNTGKWNITCDSDGAASIVCIDSSTSRNTIRHNTSADVFSCYASGQENVYIYRKTNEEPADKDIVSISLISNFDTIPFNKDDGLTTVAATLEATYDDSSKGKLTPESFDYSVNTHVLGDHTISAVYDGVTYTKTIKVTNVGSMPNNSSFDQNLETSTTTTGLSVGTENIKNTQGTLTGVDSLTINFKAAVTGTNGTTYAHGMTFKVYDDSNTVIATSEEIKVSVKASNEGTWTKTFNFTSPVKISKVSYTLSSKVSGSNVRQRSFDIEVSTNDITFAPTQANSWAEYFVRLTRTSETCLASSDIAKLSGLKAVWNELKTEYVSMIATSKDTFCNSTTDEDVVIARKHYQYIVSKFGSDQLEDFVTDSKGIKPASASRNNDFLSSLNQPTSSLILVSVISVVGGIAICLFFFIKKQKNL